MESRWKEIGKDWRICKVWMGLEWSAVMRGRAGNARLMGQMVYVIWFSYCKLENMGVKMIFLLKIDGGIVKILKDVNKCLNSC